MLVVYPYRNLCTTKDTSFSPLLPQTQTLPSPSPPPQFDLPYVRIQRVKEFRFREILRPFGSSANEEAQGSVDNLVQVGMV